VSESIRVMRFRVLDDGDEGDDKFEDVNIDVNVDADGGVIIGVVVVVEIVSVSRRRVLGRRRITGTSLSLVEAVIVRL
jgi:hypothetical protein